MHMRHLLIPVYLAAMAAPSGALAGQDQPRKDNTLDEAGHIVTQPVRDVGIDKKEVPPILQKAQDAPYALPAKRRCAAVTAELSQLDDALGPDLDEAVDEHGNRVGKLAQAGGETVINALIPFRGLVREVSGAAPADRRYATAVTYGTARRGYLRGLASAWKCKAP